MYGRLYIIRTHFLRLFQKYKSYKNWIDLSNFMMIYHFSGQNDDFAQKSQTMVMWRIIPKQMKYLLDHDSFRTKISFMTTPSGENWNFRKFYKWRHNDRKWSNSSNLCMKLLSGRLLSLLGPKENSDGILKFENEKFSKFTLDIEFVWC